MCGILKGVSINSIVQYNKEYIKKLNIIAFMEQKNVVADKVPSENVPFYMSFATVKVCLSKRFVSLRQ